MSKPYWMIEKGSPAKWWVGGGMRVPGSYIEEWTTDASKAQHFTEWGARKHAEELQSWGVKGPLRVTEHLNIDDRATPVAQPDRAAPAKVMQTIINGGEANCMQAAIASYFGVGIDAAPDLTGVVDWMPVVRGWARKRGLGFVTIAVPNEAVFLESFGFGYQIVAGKSARGREHAVVYLDGKLWHDPHPDSDGIVAVEQVDFFYPLSVANIAALSITPAEPQWIAVSERLPDDLRPKLVWNSIPGLEHDGIRMIGLYAYGGPNVWVLNGAPPGAPEPNITHWMPLPPEPPHE